MTELPNKLGGLIFPSQQACHAGAAQSDNAYMIGTMEFSHQVGALPVRRGPDGALNVLLITTLQTHRWIIPKGWPLPGCQDWAAAALEAREEAGVLGKAREGSIGSYTYEKHRHTGPVPVRVSVYLLEVSAELESWPECARRRRAWFTLADAAEAVSEPELRALLLKVKVASEEPASGLGLSDSRQASS
jgi:8-oxo-dGTP pyrophosphatase MutT (NUDIX family)